MKKPKDLHAVTVRLEAPVWERVEQLAQQDRRPVAQLLRIAIEDFAANKSVAA
jgi:predicted transcriptional regulator